MSTVPTDQEILDQVKIAIKAILDGGAVQDYSIRGRSLSRYSLQELMDLEQLYTRKIAAANMGSTRNYASFQDPQ